MSEKAERDPEMAERHTVGELSQHADPGSHSRLVCRVSLDSCLCSLCELIISSFKNPLHPSTLCLISVTGGLRVRGFQLDDTQV